MVELMLVIIILAMMAGISGTYYLGTYKKTSLKSAARNLMLMGKYARIYAIENGQSCQMHLDGENRQFFLTGSVSEGDDSGEDAMISNPYCRKTMLENEIMFEDIQIQPVAGDDEMLWESTDCITFYPDGSCDAAVIQIGNGRHSMTAIFASAYAKIRIYEGAADTVQDNMKAVDLDAMDS